MKLRYFVYTIFLTLILGSCSSNNLSKVPYISLIYFVPDSIVASSTAPGDTCYINFSFTDGAADIGYPDPGFGGDTVSAIYLKDSRSDSFVKVYFPPIDISIEDPKKGLTGSCLFYPSPQPVPRADSNHSLNGDTLTYEFYITDRSGVASNHITTHPLIVRK